MGTITTSLWVALAAIAAGGCDGAMEFHLSGDLGWKELSYAYLPSYPIDAETPWSDEAQGVAHDDTSWFITDRWSLYRYPRDANLVSGAYSDSASLPPGCSHFGDIDQVGGKVYAPLEGCGGGTPNRLYVYDASTLEVTRWAAFPAAAQTHAAWVAVMPITGWLLSSDRADHLNVFAPGFENGGELELLMRIPFERPVAKVQGGAFGPSGELYLASDDEEDPSRAGIVIVDVAEDQARELGFIPATGVGSRGREMEGITYWDLDAEAPAPARMGGQIHWILLENDWYDIDDVTFAHVSLSRPGG